MCVSSRLRIPQIKKKKMKIFDENQHISYSIQVKHINDHHLRFQWTNKTAERIKNTN